MTSSRPKAAEPSGSGTSPRAASVSNARRAASAPSRARPFDSAAPVTAATPGRTGIPGIANALARTIP